MDTDYMRRNIYERFLVLLFGAAFWCCFLVPYRRKTLGLSEVFALWSFITWLVAFVRPAAELLLACKTKLYLRAQNRFP
jgi:hypothetical protein